MSTAEHKATAPKKLKVGILSVSSTRTLKEDKSGHWIAKQSAKEGHDVVHHQVVPDKSYVIADVVNKWNESGAVHAILVTGGTGISEKDVTIEAVRPLLDKELTAFAALFAQLSYEEIDSAAIMSRAVAGTVGKTAIFCMPGSLKACKLACNALIFPELGHIVRHVYIG
ncbi:MAG: molybdenum cofactor biosynthesis protein MoaB [Deltaproteobacteria bacterium]|jgi:molybdenum cofactor biosynthesis protein B|nr:molybdenum cofactor biosynthesis protein MoaB [Deltaproteobacteria bacterium]